MQDNKISTELVDLDNLHQLTLWTPNSQQIRPTELVIQEKKLFLANVLTFYQSINDYILDIIFEQPTNFTPDGKLTVNLLEVKPQFKLIRNKFPYNLPITTQHYILWFTTKENSYTDQEIKNCIDLEIKQCFGQKREFVWYQNPKMSLPELYHVQVFIKIN